MRLKTTVLTLAVFLLPHFAADSAAASGEALMETDNENIFFEEWDTPFGIPPFDRIGDEDFRLALEAGFEAQRERITAILANPEPPDFENSILALELSGTELSRVWSVFSNLTSTDTNETLDALELEFKPRYTRQQDAIYLDPALFARVDAVYQSLDEAELDPEQRRLAELTHRDFVRSGAALPSETREQLKEINAGALEVFQEANRARESGDFKKAAGLFGKVYELAPGFVHALRRQCQAEMELGNRAEALKLCRAAVDRDAGGRLRRPTTGNCECFTDSTWTDPRYQLGHCNVSHQ